MFDVDDDAEETKLTWTLNHGKRIPLSLHSTWCVPSAEDADRLLEERGTEWLAEDPEHWPNFRLAVLDPWQKRPGQWRDDAPRWVLTLGSNTIIAHVQQDPWTAADQRSGWFALETICRSSRRLVFT